MRLGKEKSCTLIKLLLLVYMGTGSKIYRTAYLPSRSEGGAAESLNGIYHLDIHLR